MNFVEWLKQSDQHLSTASIERVVALAAEGATVPFMARYRKEQTGNLDEVAIQAILDGKETWDDLVKRKLFILGEIENQQKLTPELKARVEATFEPRLLEDLYLPFKKKRKSKATKAKEAGLEPLADWIWNCGHGTETPHAGQTLELWALTFRNEAQGITDAEQAIAGAQDILIERLSEQEDLRQQVRSTLFEKGFLKTTKGEKASAHSKYERFFDFRETVQSLLQPKNSHRYLAARRGWIEEELKLTLGGADDAEFEAALLKTFETAACTVADSPGAAVLLKAARLALKAHVLPSMESEVQAALKAAADKTAIRVFSENVRKLLMASPFGPKAVLGIDPGIRTGCKVAVVDDAGHFVGSTVLHLQDDEGKAKAKTLLATILKPTDGSERKKNVDDATNATGAASAAESAPPSATIRAIAIGNGTAGRETERFIRDVVKELALQVPVVMVNEAGASIYSASEVAREEFPELDVTVRGAISIARRLQDPLAELVKIDPKGIGVGQYQHDLSAHGLKKSLENVVDSCVNSVGVNLNTASLHLLAHVSGIGPTVAKALVEFRSAKGLFRSRQQLMDVPHFSKKTFEQAAGFLRIAGGEHALDNTGVHPERYGVLEALAEKMNKSVSDFVGAGAGIVKEASGLREELGEFTFADIVQELEKPGRDPRDAFIAFQYREDIHELKDLQPGMQCPGIVTNVTNFGAFVDIGVHQDGLVHLSQLSDRFLNDPHEAVSPGDRVQVRVLEVNLEKNQIALTMKGARVEKSHPKTRAPAAKTPKGPSGPPPRVTPRDPSAPPPPPPNVRPLAAPLAAGAAAAVRGGRMGSGAKSDGKDHRGGGTVRPPHRVPPKPKQAFNNPFAGLADLLKAKKAG